jgi:photosystem II stability/assembly factor-like uncharacterized protein
MMSNRISSIRTEQGSLKMKSRFVLPFLLAFGSALVAQSPGTFTVAGNAEAGNRGVWTPINNGLTGGTMGIQAVIPDPNNSSVAYALTTAGTIYKTTDTATTWHAVRGLTLVNSLVIDPADSNTLYAATSQGIFKSTDGGANWAGASAGLDLSSLSVSGIEIDPIDPSTIYALGSTGNGSVLKSTDGAATWTAAYTFTNGNVLGRLTIDPSVSSTLYLTMSGGAIFKSADGGLSWSQFKSANVWFAPDAMALAVDPDNSATIYAGSFANAVSPSGPNIPGSGAILKSTDGGGTWTTVSTGIPADAWVRSLLVDPANPGTLYGAYVSNNGAGLLKSVDSGESWSVLYTISNDSINSYTMVAAIGPAGLYAGYFGVSNGGLLRSGDGGSTWSAVQNGLESFNFKVLAVSPANPGTLYLGGVGGLYQFAGSAWTSLNLPAIPAEAEFQFPSATALVRSLAIDFTNPNVLYVDGGRPNGCVFDDQVLLKTTDGGANWSNSISPPDSGCLLGGYITSAPTPVFVMDPRDPQSLYLAEGEDEDGGYVLLKSTDGGANWNGIWDYTNGLQSGINALLIDPANPGIFYAGIGDAFAGAAIGFFKSTDGGATWINTGLTNTAVIVLAMDPTNSSTLYAVTQGIYTKPVGFRGMFKSTDAGATWSPINNGLDRLAQVGATIVSLAIDPTDPGTLYAATSGDGVYRTRDGGAIWASFNDGLPTFDIRAIAIAPDGVYAATASGVFRFSAGAGNSLRRHDY